MLPLATGVMVAPFTGAWIEIGRRYWPIRLHSSLPSRERGLKFRGAAGEDRGQRVAPFTGAWIEISSSRYSTFLTMSLPSRERGLKYPADRPWDQAHLSLPSRERGLKLRY